MFEGDTMNEEVNRYLKHYGGHYGNLLRRKVKAREVLESLPLPVAVRIEGKIYKVLGFTEPWDGQDCEPRACDVELRLEGGLNCHAPHVKAGAAYTSHWRIEYIWR